MGDISRGEEEVILNRSQRRAQEHKKKTAKTTKVKWGRIKKRRCKMITLVASLTIALAIFLISVTQGIEINRQIRRIDEAVKLRTELMLEMDKEHFDELPSLEFMIKSSRKLTKKEWT